MIPMRTSVSVQSVGRCSSTSSMTGLASSVSAICLSSASSGVPSTSSTKCLPWRTLVTPLWLSRPRAPSTACPWGSEISGLRTTSTTTRDTPRGYRDAHRPRSRDLHTRGNQRLIATRTHISPADGAEDLGAAVVRPPQHAGAAEAQNRPAGRDQRVLPPQVPDEDPALAVDDPV